LVRVENRIPEGGGRREKIRGQLNPVLGTKEGQMVFYGRLGSKLG